MQKIITMLALMFCMIFAGCDSDQINRPKAESRTMIIGGVPVHDEDFKRKP